MQPFSDYKLTIIGALVVLILSAGVVILLGGPTNAVPYLSILGLTIPVLLTLLRSEANASLHQENLSQVVALRGELKQVSANAETSRQEIAARVDDVKEAVAPEDKPT